MLGLSRADIGVHTGIPTLGPAPRPRLGAAARGLVRFDGDNQRSPAKSPRAEPSPLKSR